MSEYSMPFHALVDGLDAEEANAMRYAVAVWDVERAVIEAAMTTESLVSVPLRDAVRELRRLRDASGDPG